MLRKNCYNINSLEGEGMHMARPKEYERSEVLKKATQVFWEKGFEGAHLQLLVEACQINRFSLYKEFEGKSGLFHACLDMYIDESRSFYQEKLLASPLGINNIKNYFNSLSDSQNKGCFYVNTITDQNLIKPATFKLVQDFSIEIEKMFYKCLKWQSPSIPKQKAHDVAKFLVAFDQGLAVFQSGSKSKNCLNAPKKIISQILDDLI